MTISAFSEFLDFQGRASERKETANIGDHVRACIKEGWCAECDEERRAISRHVFVSGLTAEDVPYLNRDMDQVGSWRRYEDGE